MNASVASFKAQVDDRRSETAAAPIESVQLAAEQASRRIAPLWPLKNFVAVNPFLGLSAKSFDEANQIMAAVAGARMTMPRAFYRDALASGRIDERDLATALARNATALGIPNDVTSLKREIEGSEPMQIVPLATVADVASRVTARDWSTLVVDRISHWAAAYFDEGQAAWTSSFGEASTYVAWRHEAMIDRTTELMGLHGFRSIIKSLPDNAETMIRSGAQMLGVKACDLERYFHRLLMSIGGWAGHARYRVWQSELQGGQDRSVIELLAVRMAWEVALLQTHRDNATVSQAWAAARNSWPNANAPDPVFAIDGILQSAYEIAWQRQLIADLNQARPPTTATRPRVQAAFCIDVRSEVFRRSFERVMADVETIGFAGFFGFPIEYVPLGQVHGDAQCPVLLTPKFTICETVRGAQAPERAKIVGARILRQQVANAWRAFKIAAVSSFGFVETMGWSYLIKLANDGFNLGLNRSRPNRDGINASLHNRMGPQIAAQEIAGRMTGFLPEQKIAMAEAVLNAMSLRKDFARLVLLVGHGSTTANNPYASGLDCGACGGHSGEANARVAAAILNDADVRVALAHRGITIPEDTFFLGCLHDTTSDEVKLFDHDQLPSSHQQDLIALQQALAQSGHLARKERAPLLNLDSSRPIDAQVIARTRDWSQLRPEWGLAGCAAFVAAPRSRSEAIDLKGRAFLHSYDWRQDKDFGVLELIMTAPMVVASWINLQYYGSTVDNRVFGSGNKVLHNVVGTLGVLEGNGGDLRSGLPWQSLHDGERLIHEPMRLSVVIAAPIEAINAVIAKHEGVRELVDNGWIHLFAMTDAPSSIRRYTGALQWSVAG